jgi:hypothetical protein
MLALVVAIAAAAGVQETALEAFSYSTANEAQKHWAPRYDSSPVRVETLADGSTCLAFDATFKQAGNRVAWDCTSPVDLSEGGRITFDISASRTAMAKTFGIYFGAGGGWYCKTWGQTTPESWTQVTFPLKSFSTEGNPAGWDKVTQFRFSAWGATAGNVTYRVRNLRVVPDEPGENLLVNGSFEIPGMEVPYGWGCGHWGVGGMPWAGDMDLWRAHWGIDTTVAKHGTQSLRIINTPDLPLLKARSLWIPLPPEWPYVVSAWLKADREGLPVLTRFAGSEVRVTIGTEWTRVVLRGAMPERRRPMVEIRPEAPGTCWIDAVQLQAGEEATPEFHTHSQDGSIAVQQEAIDWTPPRRTAEVARGRSTAGPVAGAKARIDEHGRFLLDEKPYIQHSFGLEFVDDLSVINAVAAAGFKEICIQIHAHVTTEELKTYFDRCAEVGLRIIPWLDGNIDQERYANHIRTLRDHPALLTWYVFDEPSGERFAVANARLKIARELDPERPALINYLGSKLTGHMGDIFSTDVYPIPHGTPMGAISAVRAMATGAEKEKKPVWMWLQGTGYAYGIAREPSQRELSCMVYGSLIEGARGIYYFAQMPRSKACFDEMRAMCVEVDALTAPLSSLDPAPEIVCSEAGILYKTYAQDGAITVLAVNTDGNVKDVEFRLPSGSGEVQVVFEGRTVTADKGVWKDRFGAYERHVYRFAKP